MEIPLADQIFLIIQITCYILYILLAISFVFKLLREKHCDYDTTTFLYHFIANTFFDILQALAVIIFQKFLHWDILVSYYLSSKLLSIIYGPVLYTSILGSVLGSLITVVNRYCALYHVIFFKTYWTKKICLKIIFLQFSIPILLFSFNFFYPSRVIYVKTYNFYVFSINYLASMMNNVILSIITFICSIISIVLNIVILRKYTHVMKNATSKERSKRLLMFFYMAVTTVCLFALSIEQFVRLYFVIDKDSDGIYFLTFVLYWILPTFTIVQPITTLIMSKSLRKYFLSFYFDICLPQNYRTSKIKTLVTSVAPNKVSKVTDMNKTTVKIK